MLRIAISTAAFDAIDRTMSFGSVNFEAGVDDKVFGPGYGGRSAAILALAMAQRVWKPLIGVIGANPAGIQEGTQPLYPAALAEAFKPVTVTLPEGRQRLTRTCPR